MIKSNDILADFQFLGNRVSNFSIETKQIVSKNEKINISYEFDYNILNIEEDDKKYFGLLEFIVVVKSKVKNSILFKINLTIEGAFIGNKEKIKKEDFERMLKINGVTTLSQLSRSYILSVTALSGINPPVKLPMINIFQLIYKKEQKKENDFNHTK
ncbi:protein-export chaperone SecB [Caloramator sp. ALD01]|uniref:protein-export chaperone SecB n=1 Tax=Caloramator sp. ALD01 TaxID=1031288 RepID=UPI00042157F0|nr:protein-export chaperone SecB [Caloramator sp. ALD01]